MEFYCFDCEDFLKESKEKDSNLAKVVTLINESMADPVLLQFDVDVINPPSIEELTTSSNTSLPSISSASSIASDDEECSNEIFPDYDDNYICFSSKKSSSDVPLVAPLNRDISKRKFLTPPNRLLWEESIELLLKQTSLSLALCSAPPQWKFTVILVSFLASLCNRNNFKNVNEEAEDSINDLFEGEVIVSLSQALLWHSTTIIPLFLNSGLGFLFCAVNKFTLETIKFEDDSTKMRKESNSTIEDLTPLSRTMSTMMPCFFIWCFGCAIKVVGC